MANTTDYLAIANNGGANVVDQADYATAIDSGVLQAGYQAGIAESAQMNKTWRQSSVVAAALTQLVANINGVDVVDDGVVANLVALLATTIKTGGGTGAEGTIASAATTDLGTLSTTLVLITGTTGITSFGASASVNVPLYYVVFQSALTVTYNATSLILPGNSSIAVKAGDVMQLQYLGSGNWKCISYSAQSGAAVVSGLIPGTMTGFLFSGIGTTTLTIGVGNAVDSTGAAVIAKGTTTNWSVANGNNANGFQGGTTIPNGATLHFFMMSGTAGVASFASVSLTPTLPAGYTYYIRVGSLPTAASGNTIHASYQGAVASEVAGGALRVVLNGTKLDVSNNTLGTSAVLYPLTVPTGIKVGMIYRMIADGFLVVVTSPDEVDEAPTGSPSTGTFTTAPGYDLSTNSGSFAQSSKGGDLVTDTSGRIRARASGTVNNFMFVTEGIVDYRRVN